MLRKKSKRAEVTIESSLAILLSVVVLFLAFGIFGKNLKTMFGNSNMNNFYNNTKKTKNTFLENDPTKTQINVQAVATQGLEAYHTNSQKRIEAFASLVATGKTLTSSEILNLAEALTVFAESGDSAPSTVLNANMQGQTTSYKKFGRDNGINVDASAKVTTIDSFDKDVDWSRSNGNPYAEVTPSNEESIRITNISAIKNIFQKYE